MRKYVAILCFIYSTTVAGIVTVALVWTAQGYGIPSDGLKVPLAATIAGFIPVATLARGKPYGRPRKWLPIFRATPARVLVGRALLAVVVANLVVWLGAMVWDGLTVASRDQMSLYPLMNFTMALMLAMPVVLTVHWALRLEYLLPGKWLQILDNPIFYASSARYREECRRIRFNAEREEAQANSAGTPMPQTSTTRRPRRAGR